MRFATVDDTRFAWLVDIDGETKVPVKISTIVSAINAGLVPGFTAFVAHELVTIDAVLKNAEHGIHERLRDMFRKNDPSVPWESAVDLSKQIGSYRTRLNLPEHPIDPECCAHLSDRNNVVERVGL